MCCVIVLIRLSVVKEWGNHLEFPTPWSSLLCCFWWAVCVASDAGFDGCCCQACSCACIHAPLLHAWVCWDDVAAQGFASWLASYTRLRSACRDNITCVVLSGGELAVNQIALLRHGVCCRHSVAAHAAAAAAQQLPCHFSFCVRLHAYM